MKTEDEKAGVVGLGCLVFIIGIGLLCQLRLNQEVHTGTYKCTKTYTVVSGSGDSVSTSKRVDLRPESGAVETMRCDDALTLMRFDSGTTYGQFEVGKWSRITARGPRNPVFSMFPNVTDAVEVDHE
jgi:hypothetical protein